MKVIGIDIAKDGDINVVATYKYEDGILTLISMEDNRDETTSYNTSNKRD